MSDLVITGGTWGGLLQALRSDLQRWESLHGARLSAFRKLTTLAMPATMGVVLYRIARYCYLRNWRMWSRCFWSLQQFLTKMDISPAVEIGPGLLVGHSVGVVVSRGRIGSNVVLFGGTMVGGREGAALTPDGDPIIEDDVFVGYGSMIFGAVCIGRAAFIGVNAIVTTDVAASTVVIGRPARPLAAASA